MLGRIACSAFGAAGETADSRANSRGFVGLWIHALAVVALGV